MQSIPPETILLNLDANNANRLMLDPALGYENILQSNLNVYNVEIGQDKLTMNHLSGPTNILQPKANCQTWNPTVNYTLRPDEIVVSDYEVNGEQCTDTWDKTCTRNLLGMQEDSLYIERSPQLEPLQRAMVQTLSQSILDSAYKTAWFSDTTFGGATYPYATYYTPANTGMSQAEIDKLTTMLTVQNGVWSEIYANVSAGLIQYVDSNDGTAAGNATLPGNIADYLRQLKKSSDPLLRFWGYGPGKSVLDRAFYLLQDGLFQAFVEYLQSLGTEAAHQLILNGTVVEGAYVFNGHIVTSIPEWTMFDNEIGLIHPTTGVSRVQRAIFTVPQNISILANVKTLSGFGQSGLIIQTSTHIKDKGVKWMYYTLGLGMGIAHNKLMTVGYNSDLNTFATS